MTVPPQRRGVTLRGEFDIASSEELADRLLSASPGDLIVDMRAVSFVDSTALALLLGAARKARTTGHVVTLVCAEGPVLRMLRVTALTQTLRVVDSLAAAHALLDAHPRPTGDALVDVQARRSPVRRGVRDEP